MTMSKPYDTEDEKWRAVVSRDKEADGAFYLGVKTTGVYCRPVCPSRIPLRRNVAFFDTVEEAEVAGFRACKRCCPNDASAGNEAAIATICRWIESSNETPKLADMAQRAGFSPFHFQRMFKRITGVSPRAYAAQCRANRVREVLRAEVTIGEAIAEAGYRSAGQFYSEDAGQLGMPPTTYREGGEGQRVRFTVRPSTLGQVLVAASDRGVCQIALGDDAALLIQELQNRFPNAKLTEGDSEFEQWVEKAVAMIDHPTKSPALPLDIQGTAFQQLVWQALRNIPTGNTATYAEVAHAIGRPKAVRAVARACATNSIAVAIPCHRVIRTGGDLSGYRWGVERKRELLARESGTPVNGALSDQASELID